MDNSVELKVSFDNWKQTNVRFENGESSGSTRKNKDQSTSPPRTSLKGQEKDKEPGVGPRRRSSSRGRSGSKTITIDPRRFGIGSGRKREVIIGGSRYSRALLVNAHPLTQGPGPDNLRYLENVDHLFFKPCKKFPPEIRNFNPLEKRGIWNAGGRCVYYAGLTSYYLSKCFRSGFTYEVVDYLGSPVLTSKGSQWNFGIKGEVSVKLGNGFLLGTMEQEFFSSNYNIKDGQGRIVYTIQAPCYAPAVPFVVWCFQEEFEICMDDGISEIGRITQGGWGDEFPDFERDLGLEFETTDDNRVKALLLGVFFLIEFQYYKFGGNGIIYFILTLILFGGIVFVLSNGFGFFPEINSPIVPGEIPDT